MAAEKTDRSRTEFRVTLVRVLDASKALEKPAYRGSEAEG